jgi:hypothetical protein
VVIETDYARVKFEDVVNRKLFNFAKAVKAPGKAVSSMVSRRHGFISRAHVVDGTGLTRSQAG